jgi:phospholipid/cholesterol/gamma-HCH transport system ATP-binding protein
MTRGTGAARETAAAGPNTRTRTDGTDDGGAARQEDDPGSPAVRLDHVSKRFGALTVLDDVSFDIPKGRAFCLLGRSGTGKSVTLRHIVGLVRPDAGKVLVEGRDITTLNERDLSDVRKHMGFLFQNAALFDSMTVGDNVAFPMRRHTRWPEGEIRDRAQKRLAAVGLEHDYDKMPGDLSGGMKKRAGLARAMALGPSILLVDEPSAGLDPITAAEIDDLLVQTKRGGTTLVVVTHNIPSARVIGDDFGVLHEGRLLARGSLQELDASAEPLVQAFMRSQGGG